MLQVRGGTAHWGRLTVDDGPQHWASPTRFKNVASGLRERTPADASIVLQARLAKRGYTELMTGDLRVLAELLSPAHVCALLRRTGVLWGLKMYPELLDSKVGIGFGLPDHLDKEVEEPRTPPPEPIALASKDPDATTKPEPSPPPTAEILPFRLRAIASERSTAQAMPPAAKILPFRRR